VVVGAPEFLKGGAVPERQNRNKKNDDTDIMSKKETAECNLKEVIETTDSSGSAAYLIEISGSNMGKMHKIKRKGKFVIGRSGKVDLEIKEQVISREHAKIVEKNGKVTLFDLSTNGTFVNNKKVKKKDLKDGDKIQLGATTILKFTYQDNLDKYYHQRLYDLSVKDALTEVYSKQYYSDSIGGEFAYHKRHKVPLSLVLFDIDDFKSINDTRGHLAGDYVLKEVTKLIKNNIRQENLIARYGGDEFVIVCRGCDPGGALTIAERMRKIVSDKKLKFDDKEFSVTLSVGFATFYDDNFSSHEDLFNRADNYLYKSKTAGKNRVSYDKKSIKGL